MPDAGHKVTLTTSDRSVAALVRMEQLPVVGRLCRLALLIIGIDIPKSVNIGPDIRLPHAMSGLVLHQNTRVGHRVTILHHVTVGRSDIWRPGNGAGGVDILDDVIVGAGAVILFRSGERLVIGTGTVIGANAVLSVSTGAWEIWAGNPARMIGARPMPSDHGHQGGHTAGSGRH